MTRRIGSAWSTTQGLVSVAVLASTLLLAGCASFSGDGGMGVVQDIAGPELGADVAAYRTEEDAVAARAAVEALLKRPLRADGAVRIALLNNRGLQAVYNALGVAEAIYVKASLPPAPRFSFTDIAGSGGLEIEAQIAGSLLALATLPARAKIAAERFRQAQLQAALETLRAAAEARRSFYRAVAARELAGFLTQALTTAETAAKISMRLGESGAMTKLDQARNQVFYAELTAQLATARQGATAERERLIRALGLWGSDVAFKLPNALPALPVGPRVLAVVETEAVRRRVDLQMVRIEVDALAKSYGLQNATRFVSLIDVSGISKRAQEPGGPRFTERGAGIDVEVPIFDFGEARLREAGASYMGAVNRLIAKAVNVRSEAREAYLGYRSGYDIACHYRNEILPLRKIISDETLLRYNAMQIDVFSLLIEARQRIASITAAIEAERNFWLADTRLVVAITGGVTSGDNEPPMTAQAEVSAARD